MSDANERRGEKRARVDVNIDLSAIENYYLTQMANISTGGAFIQSKELYPVGTEMNLSFQLPNMVEKIQTKASVMWVYNQAGNREPNSSGMGVKFTDIKEEDQKKISLFIQAQTNG